MLGCGSGSGWDIEEFEEKRGEKSPKGMKRLWREEGRKGDTKNLKNTE